MCRLATSLIAQDCGCASARHRPGRRTQSPSRRRMTKSSGAESADEDMELLSQCATGRAATTPSEFETKVANLFGVQASDVAGVALVAGAGCALMTGYYLIQPLSDQLALHVGVEYTPLISVFRLILIAVINPIYSALVKPMPVERIIPSLYRMLALTLLLFVFAFALFPAGSDQLISFAFAVWSGVFSLFMISTFWARMAHLHSREEAKRVYGVIAAGSEGGQLLGSAIAALVYSFAEQRILLVSILLMEGCVHLLDARTRWRDAPPPTKAKASSSSSSAPAIAPALDDDAPSRRAIDRVRDAVFVPARLLFSTPLLRQLTLHTILINILVSGVWYERAEAVANAFASSKDRFAFFSTLNFWVAAITLLVQSLCFSRVLKHLGTTRTLLAEPLALALGLLTAIFRPGIASIALLDGLRKIVHYSLLKPTKESLYAALPTDVQYRAKPLLDTLVYRVGSVVGAAYFTWALKMGMTPKHRQLLLCGLTIAWVVNSYLLGKEAERSSGRPSSPAEGGDRGKAPSKEPDSPAETTNLTAEAKDEPAAPSILPPKTSGNNRLYLIACCVWLTAWFAKPLTDMMRGGPNLLGPPILSLSKPGLTQIQDVWTSVPLVLHSQVTHDVVLLKFALPNSRKPLGLSTASCILLRGVPGSGKESVIRPYTPVSTNAEKGTFSLLVKVYPEGQMSKHLDLLPKGGECADRSKPQAAHSNSLSLFPHSHSHSHPSMQARSRRPTRTSTSSASIPLACLMSP